MLLLSLAASFAGAGREVGRCSSSGEVQRQWGGEAAAGRCSALKRVICGNRRRHVPAHHQQRQGCCWPRTLRRPNRVPSAPCRLCALHFTHPLPQPTATLATWPSAWTRMIWASIPLLRCPSCTTCKTCTRCGGVGADLCLKQTSIQPQAVDHVIAVCNLLLLQWTVSIAVYHHFLRSMAAGDQLCFPAISCAAPRSPKPHSPAPVARPAVPAAAADAADAADFAAEAPGHQDGAAGAGCGLTWLAGHGREWQCNSARAACCISRTPMQPYLYASTLACKALRLPAPPSHCLSPACQPPLCTGTRALAPHLLVCRRRGGAVRQVCALHAAGPSL